MAEPFNTPMCILKPQKGRHDMQYSLKCMAVLCLLRVCVAVFTQRICILVCVCLPRMISIF